jgi:hypothetical protein
MKASTALIGAAVAGTASEAAGITDYTPIGRPEDDDSGGGGPGLPTLPPQAGGPDLGELAEIIGAVDRPTQTDPSELADALATDPNQLADAFSGLAQQAARGGGGGGGGGGMGGGQVAEYLLTAFEKGAETAKDTKEDAKDEYEDKKDAAEDATDINPFGNPFGDGGGSGGGPSFLDKTERAGEQTAAAGSAVEDAGGTLADTATEGGQTIWEASKLLATGEADTSDTWAEDRGEVSIGVGLEDTVGLGDYTPLGAAGNAVDAAKNAGYIEAAKNALSNPQGDPTSETADAFAESQDLPDAESIELSDRSLTDPPDTDQSGSSGDEATAEDEGTPVEDAEYGEKKAIERLTGGF